MPFDWGEKLLDLVCGGAPALVKALPAHWRRQASERLKDFNPFATIAANEDLLRAMRLAWIEAALDVDAAVLRMTEVAEWRGGAMQAKAFSDFFRAQLRTLRHEACNRNVHPGSSAIDAHLNEVLVHVPDFIRAAAGPRPGEVLTRRFVSTLAAVTGWPEAEVPGLYGRLAEDGLPLEGRSSNRTFGELVFSAFAEVIKSPNRYPEAGVAFGVAMDGMARELAQAALQGIGGIDCKIDAVLLEVRALPDRNEGLEPYLKRVDTLWAQRWADLTSQVARVEDKVDASAAVLQQILAAVAAHGQIGVGPNQVAHDTVLALAKRLKPDELLDFDRAVTELEFAIGVALQVMTQRVGHAGHADRFVDDVMHRVVELTAAGRLEQGATSIDNALAELDRREAEQREVHRRQRAGLLEAAIRQGVLLRDVARVTSAVVALAALACPARPSASDAFRSKLEAFYVEGRDRGTKFSLVVALALARLRWRSAQTLDEKGEALVWLGTALSTLGERDHDPARLEEAVQTYRAALKKRTRERVPLDWATTQNNLGNVLWALGQCESSAPRLEEAVQAYRLALDERTRERVPLNWATTQNNLGNALQALGRRESDTSRVEVAVQSYRAALEECPRERMPLDWAMMQNNLGNALQTLGQSDSDTARLQEAEQAYRAALEERTRDRVPLDWAMTQNNLGHVLQIRGQRECDPVLLEEAAQAYHAALEECTRERVPLSWAMVQHNLGDTLWALGERETGPAHLEEAVQAYRAALEERTRERVPLSWATTQNNLGVALHSLGRCESDAARLEEAVQAHCAALKEFTHERVPLNWATTQINLGNALWTLGERDTNSARLVEAVRAYHAALEECTRERVPLEWAMVQNNLGNALWALGERETGQAHLEEAVQAYRAAVEELTQEKSPERFAPISAKIAAVVKLIEQRQGAT
jgi:tetratricopeptide (TPR) repeat protein